VGPPFDLWLREEADLDLLLERSRAGPALLFKHSTACPTSADARAEIERFLEGRRGKRPFAAAVRVIEERPVSQSAASRLGVRHESPQLLLLRDGAAVGHLSHDEITAEAVADRLSAARG
jgi:bacillithiol system protein YtxJ